MNHRCQGRGGRKRQRGAMGIPDRWLAYDPIGRRIPSTPFISFKTPLQEKCSGKSDGGNQTRFTPYDVCQDVKRQGHELALVIDLTNTFKYYNGDLEFRDKLGVDYRKIKCEGHHVPSDFVFQRFADTLCGFIVAHGLKSNKVVGVHCTHGLNRSGYLVCRYLIEFLGFHPDQAIIAFNAARGHEMERQNYLEDLRRRMGQWKIESFHAAHSIGAVRVSSCNSEDRRSRPNLSKMNSISGPGYDMGRDTSFRDLKSVRVEESVREHIRFDLDECDMSGECGRPIEDQAARKERKLKKKLRRLTDSQAVPFSESAASTQMVNDDQPKDGQQNGSTNEYSRSPIKDKSARRERRLKRKLHHLTVNQGASVSDTGNSSKTLNSNEPRDVVRSGVTVESATCPITSDKRAKRERRSWKKLQQEDGQGDLDSDLTASSRTVPGADDETLCSQQDGISGDRARRPIDDRIATKEKLS